MPGRRGIVPETQVGDALIAWQVDGPASAPGILLSNSLGTSRELWNPQLEALAQRFRVVRYDTRGHGRSGAPDRDYSLDELGADALAVLDAAGIQRAHIAGVSLGGLTGMWLGVHAPERVASLILANTAAHIGTLELWEQRIGEARRNGMGGLAELMMPRWFTDTFRRTSPDIVDAFRSMVASCNPAGYVGCCAALRDADVRAELPRIRARTLVIVGQQDPSTPPEQGAAVREAIGHATLTSFHAAHLSNVECAAAFTSEMLSFLQGGLDG
jgi:3-oxoadipate enol-lactonase